MKINHYTKQEIENDIQRIKAILNSGIFEPERGQDPLFNSALTELLIRVRDLLAKAETYESYRVH